MEYIQNIEEPDDDFILMFTRMSFKVFMNEFNDDAYCQKKLRNDYDNRFKARNLQTYYFYFKIKNLRKEKRNQQRTIGCLLKKQEKNA